MKGCISFALWGDKPMYCKGAIENVRLAKIVYPGWTCRFIIPDGDSVLHGRGNVEQRITAIPESVVIKLEAEGAEIVRSDKNSWNLMLSRFYAIEDYDVVIIRDADSRLTFRESAAVDAWLASDKTIHAMRDHPWHFSRSTHRRRMRYRARYSTGGDTRFFPTQYFVNGKNFVFQRIWGEGV